MEKKKERKKKTDRKKRKNKMKSKDKNNVQSEGMSFSIFFLSMSKAFAGVRVRGSVLQTISKDIRAISKVEKKILDLP